MGAHPPKEPSNPFERFGIDPLDGARAITERLRELAEDASSPAERDAIRAAWEELTMHPARRLHAALGAAPETRAPLGRPPPNRASTSAPLTIADLAPRPSVAAALGRGRGADPELPSLADDPALTRAAAPGPGPPR
jgi:hypothetical protein